MRKVCLLSATALLASSLFADVYCDSLTNLAYAAARTNAHLLVGQQAAANSNNVLGTILQASLESGFSATGTLSNTLNRVLSGGTAAATTAATNATTTAATNATRATAPGVGGLLNFLSTGRQTPTQSTRSPSQRRQPRRRQFPGF